MVEDELSSSSFVAPVEEEAMTWRVEEAIDDDDDDDKEKMCLEVKFRLGFEQKEIDVLRVLVRDEEGLMGVTAVKVAGGMRRRW